MVETSTVPSGATVMKPASKAASRWAARSKPLKTSRRSASVLQAAQGMMWLARKSSGTARPVIAHRPSQYSNRPRRKTS